MIRLLYNKYRRGSLKLADISFAVKAAILDLFFTEVKKYRDSNTDVIPEPVKKFVTTQPVVITSGIGSLPAAAGLIFHKEITFTTSDGGSEGEWLHPEAFDDRLRSLILPPSSEFPIAKIQNGTIIIAPSSITKINLTYFRLPIDFIYAVTYDADGRGEVFAPGSSTDTEFGLEYASSIVKQASQYLGIAGQNPDVTELQSAK